LPHPAPTPVSVAAAPGATVGTQSIAGAVNLLMALTAAALAIWRPSLARKHGGDVTPLTAGSAQGIG
jgi:hypothetical protein